MSLLIRALAAIITTFLLAACSAQPTASVYCQGGSETSTRCSGFAGLIVVWNDPDNPSLSNAFATGLQNELLNTGAIALDFSASNVNLISESGHVNIALSLAGGGTVSQSFVWIRQGSQLVPQDTHALEAWMNQYASTVTNASLSLNEFQVTNPPGTNVVSVEAVINGQPVIGAATAWYNGGGGGSCPECVIK